MRHRSTSARQHAGLTAPGGGRQPVRFSSYSRAAARPPNTNLSSSCERGVSALRHWIEPKRESPREAMLTLRLKWMKLSSVNVAQQPLESHAPEQPSTAHRLERLFDGQS